MINNKRKNILLLVARVIVGVIFIATGWMKVADMAATVGFFQSLGIPAFLAYIVGYAELIGGILLVFGTLMNIVALVLGIIMIVAVCYMKGAGLSAYGFPLSILASLLALAAAGAGNYAWRTRRQSLGATSTTEDGL